MNRCPLLALIVALAVLVSPLALAGGKPPNDLGDSNDDAPDDDGEAPERADAFVLDEATWTFPEQDRTAWAGEWKSAKAYRFNFGTPYGPGAKLFAWRDGEWHPNVEETVELDDAMAAAALELVHRGHGELLMSKCPYPRHAVVFFDAEGAPIASVNVCFECTDILVWPPYYGEGDAAEAAEDAKWSAQPELSLAQTKQLKAKRKADPDWEPENLMTLVNAEVLDDWGRFFGSLGMPLEPGEADAIERAP